MYFDALKSSFEVFNTFFENLQAQFGKVNTIYKAVFTVIFNLEFTEYVRVKCMDTTETSDRNSFCFASVECENFLEDGLSSVCASSQGVLKRESGSESDLFPLPGDGMEDLVFGKVGKLGWVMVKKTLKS